MPTSLDHVLDTEVKLATHHDRVRFTRQLVEEVERDGVDFVIHVQARRFFSTDISLPQLQLIGKYHLMYFL